VNLKIHTNLILQVLYNYNWLLLIYLGAHVVHAAHVFYSCTVCQVAAVCQTSLINEYDDDDDDDDDNVATYYSTVRKIKRRL